MRRIRKLLPILLLSLSGCAAAVATVRPPACPEAGAEVVDELSQLSTVGYPALWAYLGRLKQHCDAIDRLRRG